MIQQNRIRDERSNAVLNTDVEALNKYKKERDNVRKIEMLSREVKEIKETLNRLITIIEKN
jgi:hypothetical protein